MLGAAGTGDWVAFPGGELEGKRPKVRCAACRAAADRGVAPPAKTLCFECYRADLARERALSEAARFGADHVERFQDGLPFEAVDEARLARLKSARADERKALSVAPGRFVDRRRQAQLMARRALGDVARGLAARKLLPDDRRAAMADAIHAAELQLPDAWLPFVMSR
jgi:hypothetical protein